MAKKHSTITKLAAALNQLSPSAQSLIITTWGDSILAFGGQIWLGSLVRLMQPLGINARLVRTCVQRLVSDEWLKLEAVGRKRDIIMTEERVNESQSVQRRIYTEQVSPWDGRWHLVIAGPSSAARREALRREMGFLGYAALSPNQYIHPHDRWQLLKTRLQAKDMLDEIGYRFDATSEYAQEPLVSLWPLGEIRADWQRLADIFSGLAAQLKIKLPGDAECFVLRTLAVHNMRRTVLRDPGLPGRLLPDDWPERAARRDFRKVWTILKAPSNRFSTSVLERSDQIPIRVDTENTNWLS
ncbi:MAG: PaaX family transcriptional regulator C-terminal domain-containing protein [Pseudomonadales bacterium]